MQSVHPLFLSVVIFESSILFNSSSIFPKAIKGKIGKIKFNKFSH